MGHAMPHRVMVYHLSAEVAESQIRDDRWGASVVPDASTSVWNLSWWHSRLIIWFHFWDGAFRMCLYRTCADYLLSMWGSTRVSHQWHYWHFGPDRRLFVLGTVLFIVRRFTGLYPLGARSAFFHLSQSKNVFGHCQVCPEEQNCL